MYNLVYMRMATHVVVTTRQTIWQRKFKSLRFGGFSKFGMTPGGGFNPGQVGPKKGAFKHSGANMTKNAWGTAALR